MQNIIIGGAGFIGSHLTAQLLERGEMVTVIDNFSTGKAHRLPSHNRLTVCEYDASKNLPQVDSVDTVYHLASIADPNAYQENPIATLNAGSKVTRATLELAKENNAQYFFASTSEVYGDPKQHPQSEGYNGNVSPTGPRSCYDESKRFSEALVTAYEQEYNVDVRIARIFNTYGPMMDDGRVIPTFVKQALNDKPLTVHGDGTQTRSFCFIDDLLNGIDCLLESQYRKPVNLGNDDERTIRDIANIIIELADAESPITFTERPEDDPQQRQPDLTLAKNKLNWQPTTELQEGLKQTISYWCQRS